MSSKKIPDHKLNPPVTADEAVVLGFVYRIYNKRTGHSYIGLTSKTPEQRFKEHIYKARIGKSDSKLSQAIRKYGAEAFTIEVLARTRNRKRLAELECKFIAQYHAITNGYNTYVGGNLGGQSGKQIEYNGEVYRTVTEFCKRMGLDNRVFNKRRAKGWSPDECVKGRKKRDRKAIPIEYNGVVYPSIRDFCKAIGKNYRSFESRTNRGWDLQRNLEYTASCP